MLTMGVPGPDWALSYAAGGAAVWAGALLTVRTRPGKPGGSLLLIPLVAAYARFGGLAAPLVFLAVLIANLIRGTRPVGAATSAARELLAFAIAHAATIAAATLLAAADVGASAGLAVLPDLIAWSVFALVFASLHTGLHFVAARVGPTWTGDSRAQQPDLVLAVLTAPVSIVPALAWLVGGDGPLLIALAALLMLLFVMREAVNLATARAEAEAERDQLQRARALQDDLIHLITHEVKNPLTAVLGYTELAQTGLRRQPEPNLALERHLDRIHLGGKAIEALLDNLLELRRVEKLEEAPREPVELRALAAEVIADFEPLADQKHQTILSDLDEEVPPANGTRVLLRETLSNLVSNAVKYTPEGGRVTVWVRAAPEPGMVGLGVTDTGIGLSEADRAQLFTKFFRSADPRVHQERGSGLGLALSSAIVGRMGGRITVESTLNQGATFSILLPSDPGVRGG